MVLALGACGLELLQAGAGEWRLAIGGNVVGGLEACCWELGLGIGNWVLGLEIGNWMRGDGGWGVRWSEVGCVDGLLGCSAARLLCCWVARLLGCWAVGLLGCWVAGLLGGWVGRLVGCWAAGLLSC